MSRVQVIGKGRLACRIPRGYFLFADGVYARAPKAKRVRVRPSLAIACPPKLADYLVRVCWQPLWIAGYGRDIDTGNQFLRLRTIRNGQLLDEWIERGIVLHDFKIGALNDRGFPTPSVQAKAIVTYLAALDARNAPLQLEAIVNRHGYVPCPGGRHGWVIGDKWIGPPGTRAYIAASALQHPLVSSIRRQGELEHWMELVRPFFRNHGEQPALTRWMIALSFAPPLLRLLNQRSFVVHQWGKSGAGKSAVTRLAAAVWGDPDVFAMTLNRTVKSFGETFRYFSDLPALFDELQAAEFRREAHQIGLMIHSVVQQQSRVGANRHGGNRNQVTWRTVLKLNGEEPILGNSRIDLGGYAGRVLQTQAATMDLATAKHVNEQLNEGHFGHAGPAFLLELEKIANDPKRRRALQRTFDDLENNALQLVIETAQRRAPMLAVVALAEILFRMWFFGESFSEAKTLSIEDMLVMAESIDLGPTPDVAQSAREIFQAFRAANPGSFVVRKFTDERPKDRNLAGYVIDRKVGGVVRKVVAWIPRHAHDLLLKHGLNPDRALMDMVEEGFLYRGKTRLTMQVRTHPRDNQRFWAYLMDLGDSDKL